MKTKNKPYLPLLLALALTAPAARSLAQTFDSGSTGALGELNVTSNTNLDMPPDGIFHFTTITVASGKTLRFNRNALNTPVYLLATGNITINGTIDVSGEANPSANPLINGGAGGPGGFDGGKPDGPGHGPGGGRPGNYIHQGVYTPSSAGAGAYASVPGPAGSTNGGTTYGSPLLVPLVGGSGGGGGLGGFGGGGGGGAILLASNTRITVSGNILAREGEPGGFNSGSHGVSGSAGAIRLVAPVVSGSGGLYANTGRARIDTIDRSGVNITIGVLSYSLGTFMTVFPPNLPRLDILQTADTNIPEGTNAPVFVTLPFGSDTNRTVTVQARNFNSVVPIEVVLTPDSGQPIKIMTTIDNTASNPASVVVPVGFPINTVVAVNVWRR